jgi:hypothetical protein
MLALDKVVAGAKVRGLAGPAVVEPPSIKASGRNSLCANSIVQPETGLALLQDR